MDIYLVSMFESPTTDRILAMKSAPFAHFSVLGTWSQGIGKLCEECGDPQQDYVEPLLVQWEPSTDQIGDFSWDGPFGYVFIVKDRLADFLRTVGFGCDFFNVKYVRPESERKRGAKLVPYPYKGPKLLWAECRSLIDLDMKASDVKLEVLCKTCGNVRYTFRNKGIVIRRRKWHGEKMFRITTNDRSSATFVSDEGRRLIQEAGFSNVAFTMAGQIVN